MKVGDKVRATRDHWCEPLFDEGWQLKKGMIGVVYAIENLDDGEIAVDFGEAFFNEEMPGWVVLVVPLDAIESIS